MQRRRRHSTVRQADPSSIGVRLPLVVCVILALIGQPIGAPLHLVLATHAHVYCPEHRQFEDVVRWQPCAEAIRDACARTIGGRDVLTTDEQQPAGSHVRCTALNAPTLNSASEPSSAFCWVCCPPDVTKDVKVCTVGSPATCFVLALAPKRSPPAGACQLSSAA